MLVDEIFGWAVGGRRALFELQQKIHGLQGQVDALDTRQYLRSQQGIISAGKMARAIRLGR